jgi:hypothetical protein
MSQIRQMLQVGKREKGFGHPEPVKLAELVKSSAMNKTLALTVSVSLQEKEMLTVQGQQIPCRYAGGVLADQGFDDLVTDKLMK